ncbi:transglutaminase-like domain-containing protein, partial [bacterium]|nr:transglutaminase-like domain-containing protein [bacterium]
MEISSPSSVFSWRKSMRILMKILALILILIPCAIVAASERQIEATYTATIESIPAGTQKLNIWIPLPAETPHQSITALNFESSSPAVLRHDPEFGNAYIFLNILKPKQQSLKVKIHFRAERLEVRNSNLLPAAHWDPAPGAFERYLKPDRLVTISKQIKDISQTITKDLTTNDAKAKSIYSYVLGNMTYDKLVPGWGKGDTERACKIKKGNC